MPSLKRKGNKSNKYVFFHKYSNLFYVLLGVILVGGIITLSLYLAKVGIFKQKTLKPSPSPTPSPTPTPDNKIVGSWINVSSPPWDSVKNQDLLMLASYTPNPWSILYPCTNAFSIAPENYDNIKTLVATAKQKSKIVLISVGGSSFGEPEWSAMLYKYTKYNPQTDCQCPSGSYWFGCSNVDPENCCPEKDKKLGKCGGVFKIKSGSGDDCCNFKSNPHQCCCGYGSKLVPDGKGGQICIASNPPNCQPPGIIKGREQILKQCIQEAGTDTNKRMKCILDNCDPVLAYADLLQQTGADGIDLDFESPDAGNLLATALVHFCNDLKLEMKNRGKQIYFSITILSGNSYEAQYGPLYTSLRSNNSPFDFAIPMLYNGGQYPYDPDKETTSQTSWNGLLNYWRLNYLTKDSNAKLIAAFIEYQNNPAFTDTDLKNFLNNYITNPLKDGGVNVNGVVYFYYSTDYNISLLNQNLLKSIDCFKNKNC